MKTFWFLVLLCFTAVARAETPNEGAKAILGLVQAENYTELAQTRYAEWYKAERDKIDPAEAVEKLAAIWKKGRPVLLAAYEQMTTAEFTIGKNETPQPGETGEIATTKITIKGKTMNFTLYRLKTARWGFRQ